MLSRPELLYPPNPYFGPSREGDPTVISSDILFRIPLWIDISLHAIPPLALLTGKAMFLSLAHTITCFGACMRSTHYADFFLFERPYEPPISTRGATVMTITFGTSYGLWVEICANINAEFPYPFMNLMNPIQRVTMYTISMGLSLAAFRGLNSLHP